MIELCVKSDYDEGYKYYISTFKSAPDEEVATYLKLDLFKYRKILSKYGAFAWSCEFYFKTEEDAQKCLDYLKQETYIKDYECLCDREFESGNYAEICKNENGSHRLIIYCEDDEFHSGEIQINFCPICGRKLN